MPMLGGVVGALVWSLLAWTGTTTAGDDDGLRQVLLLYAESRLLPAIVSADATFRSTLSSSLGAPVDFRTEFLDLPATPNAPYERRLRDLLRLKYEGVHFDLVVVLAVRALRIALDYRGELAPGAPVVFMAGDAIDLPALPPEVAGVFFNLDWMDTLGAALRLQPETRHVVVVGGTSAIDQRFLASARAAFAGARVPLEVTYLTGPPLEAVAAQLAALPAGTIVIQSSFTRDGADRNLATPVAVEQLAKVSRVPVYGLGDTQMGHGIVGGRLVDFDLQGERAGELGLRLLRGEKLGPVDIVTRNTNTYT